MKLLLISLCNSWFMVSLDYKFPNLLSQLPDVKEFLKGFLCYPKSSCFHSTNKCSTAWPHWHLRTRKKNPETLVNGALEITNPNNEKENRNPKKVMLVISSLKASKATIESHPHLLSTWQSMESQKRCQDENDFKEDLYEEDDRVEKRHLDIILSPWLSCATLG